MPFHFERLLVFGLCFLLSACTSAVLADAPAGLTETASPFTPATETLPSVATSTPVETPTETTLPDSPTEAPFETVTSTPAVKDLTATLPAELDLDPADWHDWPIIPIVPEKVRIIYQFGQTLGNDPHAFSILGDCQSEPQVFLGVYESDPEAAAGLLPDLQETLTWFSGSFDRNSPTLTDGTTAGALLWPAWHKNLYGCGVYETPLECELRIHKPSFVFVHVGTHYEDRNEAYLREVLDQLIAAGVVPILATKADNIEVDERVNASYAQLAVEYDLPLWNFWAAADSLPNRGLYARPDLPLRGDVYLTNQALVIHRLTALQTLDVVWQAVTGP
ncbi:MAG: hypothetical protein HY781_09215 [Chloroflexi bacterium]|nr:hypothetical protein [Chloroflexota bacterium]